MQPAFTFLHSLIDTSQNLYTDAVTKKLVENRAGYLRVLAVLLVCLNIKFKIDCNYRIYQEDIV